MTSSPYNFFLAIQNVENWCGWSYQPTFIQRTLVYLSHNRLLLQIGWSYPLEGGKTSDVIKFIKHYMVYSFGMQRQIIHDNGPQFVSQAFQRFRNKFRIQIVSSTTYYPVASGLVEAFNKTIGKLLKKFTSKSQHDWDDKLGEWLWTYHTTVRILTKAAHSLWYAGVKPYFH